MNGSTEATGPPPQPGPGGYGYIPPDPPQPAAGEPEPLQGTVAVRERGGMTGPPETQRRKAEPIDGALLWTLVNRYLAFYVAFRTKEELNRVTAWVFHACARKRGEMGMGPLIGNASPRLLVKSRKRGAGKSTLLRLIGILTGSSKAPRITAASFAQIISQAYEAVCIDEGRLVFGAGAKQQDLQACVLDGYTPGTYYRVSKTKLSLFGPVAIAAKESLITDATKAVDGDESSIGDILDRCLTVTLTAPDMPPPEVGKRAQAEGEVLARALVAWTDTYRDALEQAAENIADEDHVAAQQRARRGEKQTETPRALQIGRPLRAIGRVIDQQVIAEARHAHRDSKHRGRECDCPGGFEDPEPQVEAEILACLGTQAEDIMAELQELSQGWGDAQFTDDEDEPGRVVFGSEPADDDPLAVFTPAPPSVPTPRPATQYEAQWTVRYSADEQQSSEKFGPFASRDEAETECETAHAECLASDGITDEHPLFWQRTGPSVWGATVRLDGSQYPEVSYTVSVTRG